MTGDEKTKLLVEILKCDSLAISVESINQTALGNYLELRRVILTRLGRIDR